MPLPLKELANTWQQVMQVLQTRLKRDTLDRWFSHLLLLKDTGKVLYVGAPDDLTLLWVEANYSDFVGLAVQTVLGEPRKLKYELALPNIPDQDANDEHNTVAPQAPPANNESTTDKIACPKKQHKQAKTDTQQSTTDVPAPETRKRIFGRAPSKGDAMQLNPQFTLDQFVIGDHNSFASAAVQMVLSGAATVNFPLYFYGPSGSGKSHLLQAIAHAVLAENPHAKVVCSTGENFANEYFESAQQRNYAKLRRKYRRADILIVDDVQFFASKGKTTEEFLNTIIELSNAHIPIVLCADRPVSQIAGLEKRLSDRIEAGLNVEMCLPEYEDRLSILHSKSAGYAVNIDPAVIEMIAQRIDRSVRLLEGALVRVAAYCSLSHKPLDIKKAKAILHDMLAHSEPRRVTVADIQKHVATFYQLELADILSKRRPAHISMPRQVAMYLARQLTPNSLQEIGRAFGGRDHGTVIHAFKAIELKMQADKVLAQAVKTIQKSCQG